MTPFEHAGAFRHLGSALRSAGFTGSALRECLAIDAADLVRAPDLPTASLRLGEAGDALATLVCLFYLNLETRLEPGGLGDRLIEELLDAEVLVRDRGTMRATIRLTPYRGLIVASDPLSAAAPDLVQGITLPADLLASITVRDRIDRVLDLGAGGGIQALLAARHAGQVTAVDTNLRSAWFVHANAALNGIHNIAAVTGDWFTPVSGETFDLIVCNPPYVVSPDSTYLYRDGGWHGDDLCWSLVRDAAARLREGGYAHIVCNWIEGVPGGWPEVVRRRVEDLPCDVCVVRYGGSDPLSYAAAWNRTVKDDRETYDRIVREWLAYYARLGVREIGQGVAMLRRPRGRPPRLLLREGTMLPKFEVSAGDHTRTIFDAMEIGIMTDSDVRQSRLVAAGGLSIEQRYTTRDGTRFAAAAATVSRDPGLGVGTLIDADDVPVLLSLRPDRTLGEVVSEVEVGASGEGVQMARAVRTVRELIALGMVSVAANDPGGS